MENYIHLCTCSCQISPSDARLHLVDPFSNAWHETSELHCCRKKMKGLHWGAGLWQRHPATRSMCTRKPQDVYRQKCLAGSLPVRWISSRRWTLRSLLCLCCYTQSNYVIWKDSKCPYSVSKACRYLIPFSLLYTMCSYYLAPQEGCNQLHCVYTLMEVLCIESSWLQRLHCILQSFLMCFKTWYFATPS